MTDLVEDLIQSSLDFIGRPCERLFHGTCFVESIVGLMMF